jgi:peptide-methionine (S)-S-oxide reductase
LEKRATFAGGCFWCTETLFQRLEGVFEVIPGYSGGQIKNPSYREVCTGRTGHAECVSIGFDDDIIAFNTLLDVFMHTHDPTSLNRQGQDVGTQYRSAIFYHDEDQKLAAKKIISACETQFNAPIVTEVVPFDVFYPAEIDHHNYYNLNKSQPYCNYVISPKVGKLLKDYKEYLKENI